MKIEKLVLPLVVFALLVSCCSNGQREDEDYHPLGTAILIANRQVIAEYPTGLTEDLTKEKYLSFLKEDYSNMYNILESYDITITKSDTRFIVKLFDEDELILVDYACTESSIDCWCYNGECDPDTLTVDCMSEP